MKPETLEALKGSIEKWRQIVEESGEDHGSFNCPLCDLFNRHPTNCRGCPVNEKTKRTLCADTPYVVWDQITNYRGGKANTPEKLIAARAELEFLRSLLPKEGER